MPEQEVPRPAPKILPEPPLAPQAELGPYRRNDYMALPHEPRCELILGRLYVYDSKTALHQLAVQCLGRYLCPIAEAAEGFAMPLRLDVVLADHTVVQPDVIYVSKSRLEIVHAQVEGAPDLLVEVVSPRTARCDRGEKLKLYAECGVPEYWIVDPDSLAIECLVNEGGRFVVSLPTGGRVRSTRLPEIEFEIAGFWGEFLATLRRTPRVRRCGQGYERPTRAEFEHLRGRLRLMAGDLDQFLAEEQAPELRSGASVAREPPN